MATLDHDIHHDFRLSVTLLATKLHPISLVSGCASAVIITSVIVKWQPTSVMGLGPLSVSLFLSSCSNLTPVRTMAPVSVPLLISSGVGERSTEPPVQLDVGGVDAQPTLPNVYTYQRDRRRVARWRVRCVGSNPEPTL
jgi:hypothetical protein